MKTTCTLLMLAFALAACHYNDRNDSHRYTPNREYRHTDTPRQRNTRPQRRTQKRSDQRRPDNMNTLPYLPPFTMRWDCPTEPQMLGFMTR